MSRVISRLKAHFFRPTLFRRTGPNLLVPIALFAGLFVILTILKFFENPNSVDLDDIISPTFWIGFSLILAAEVVGTRGRLVLAGILRIAAYFLIGISGILVSIGLIGLIGRV